MGTLTISSNAPDVTFKPKNMLQLYGNRLTYLLRKGDVLHILWGVDDWASTEQRFGAVIAEFNPWTKKWATPIIGKDDAKPLSLADLRKLIGKGEVCMLGKDCPKHPAKDGNE